MEDKAGELVANVIVTGIATELPVASVTVTLVVYGPGVKVEAAVTTPVGETRNRL